MLLVGDNVEGHCYEIILVPEPEVGRGADFRVLEIVAKHQLGRRASGRAMSLTSPLHYTAMLSNSVAVLFRA